MIPFAIKAMIQMRNSFDVIYCPGYQGIGIAAIIAGKLLRKPVLLGAGNLGVLSCRTWDGHLQKLHIRPHGVIANCLKWPVRRLYASATAFACIAKEIEKEAIQCNISRNRVHYLPNTVDLRKFRPATVAKKRDIRIQEGWSQDKLIIIYVGRLSREKGVLDLLTAWNAIKHDRAHLVVIGPDMPGHDMNVGDHVRASIKESNIEDHVTLCGPRDDTCRLLQGADVFVQPSHYEAFGISVIEAMATGLPVIATGVGGMKDYLVDGSNALFFQPQSPQDLSEKLERLINERSLRSHLGSNARITVEKSFDETVVFDQFANLFSRLTHGS
jgi:glycosyltransferase involved in cell wall biosynthesis